MHAELGENALGMVAGGVRADTELGRDGAVPPALD
jgi:hypothetical protein